MANKNLDPRRRINNLTLQVNFLLEFDLGRNSSESKPTECSLDITGFFFLGKTTSFISQKHIYICLFIYLMHVRCPFKRPLSLSQEFVCKDNDICYKAKKLAVEDSTTRYSCFTFGLSTGLLSSKILILLFSASASRDLSLNMDTESI